MLYVSASFRFVYLSQNIQVNRLLFGLSFTVGPHVMKNALVNHKHSD